MTGRILNTPGQPPVRRQPAASPTRNVGRHTPRRGRDEVVRRTDTVETKPWGDTPRLPKPKNNIRVLLHNIQGLKRGKHGRSQVAELDTEIARLNIDILAMTEINNHFKILPAQDQWSERMQALPRNHSVCATNIHSASNRNHLYGGSAQMLFGPMSYRATTSERDPAGLGRWVSTRCQGKGGICIRFITGYRPNLDRDGGPYTVYSQQEKKVQAGRSRWRQMPETSVL